MEAEPRPQAILYVDDDGAPRRAFSILLKKRGFDIDTASSGFEALQMLSERTYAVVVTDLRMPGLDGLSLIEQIRVVAPTTTFILVTGLPQLDLSRFDFRDRGLVAVLPKPFESDLLVQTLARALALHDLLATDGCQALTLEARPGRAEELARSLAAERIESKNVRDLSQALLVLPRFQPEIVIAQSAVLGEGEERVESLRRIRAAAPSCAVLVVCQTDADGERATEQGAEEYLLESETSGRVLRRGIRYAIDRRLGQRRIEALENEDLLTGLPGRASFRDLVRRRLESDHELAVLVIGVDRFRSFNDGLGHDAGDQLLRSIGARLVEHAPADATVARLGGDEFGVVLEVPNENAAMDWSRRFIAAMAPPFVMDGVDLTITVSIGAAFHSGAASGVDGLLRSAESAMRSAKRRGRNNVHLYTDDGRGPATQRLVLERELREALDLDRFILHYQPQRDLRTGRVRGAEGLLRMRRTDGSLVPPGHFIPILEDTELMTDVGAWVLRSACRRLATWHDAGHSYMTVAVNLSARQFEQGDLVRIVEEAIAEAGIPARCLELEITESLLMQDTELTNRTLSGLKALGTRIAIDDFGTGYSSLSYLDRFDVDVLKVDRSFVSAIGSGSAGSIALAVIDLGHRLGLEVVAEGVETSQQLSFLCKTGCEVAQGYLIGRPTERWSPKAPSAVMTADIMRLAASA